MTPVNNRASNSKTAKPSTPAKNQLMKTHQSLTMTPVQMMKKLNNPVITIPDNDDNVSFVFSQDTTKEDNLVVLHCVSFEHRTPLIFKN